MAAAAAALQSDPGLDEDEREEAAEVLEAEVFARVGRVVGWLVGWLVEWVSGWAKRVGCRGCSGKGCGRGGVLLTACDCPECDARAPTVAAAVQVLAVLAAAVLAAAPAAG